MTVGRFARKLVGKFWRRSAGDRGQSATEYMLLISVIVIAIVGVTYTPMGRAISAGSTRFDKKASEGTKRGGFGLQGNEQR